MTFDARPQALDARSTDFDGAHRVRSAARGATTPVPADDETTVVRLAGARDLHTAPSFDDDVTVLRIARRARQAS
jgi:hypothetical protein